MNIRKIFLSAVCGLAASNAAFAATQVTSKTYVDAQDATKADLTATDATGGQVAIVDVNGQYVRSATALGDLSTDSEVAAAIATAVTNVESTINTTIAGVETDIDAKADKATTGTSGNLLQLTSDGNYADAGLVAANVVTTDNLEYVLDDQVELKNNKVSRIYESTAATMYPSVGALRQYTLPVPPAECASVQCVLSATPGGVPYWDKVILPTS